MERAWSVFSKVGMQSLYQDCYVGDKFVRITCGVQYDYKTVHSETVALGKEEAIEAAKAILKHYGVTL